MPAPKPKIRILFLCTGNSCRSQMAEGWARHLKAGVIEACSAGIEKHGLDPHAVQVMAEAGVDISRQWSKTVEELMKCPLTPPAQTKPRHLCRGEGGRAGKEKNSRSTAPEISSGRQAITFDYVVTVCGHANEHCPVFPGKTKVVHIGFDDPPQLARDAKTGEEVLGYYRRARDEIRAFIETLPERLTVNAS